MSTSLSEPRFRSGVLYGWRGWRVVRGSLVSVSSGQVWPGFERLEATHELLEPAALEEQGHGADPPCLDALHCGIYAYRSPAHFGDRVHNCDAWGEVKLWGRVIEHEAAYRAQYAYPSLVVCRKPLDAALIERNYGCQVLVDPDAERPIEQPQQPPPVPAIPAVDAAISTRLGVNLSMQTPLGRWFNYQGALDPLTVGRWFGGLMQIIGEEADRQGQTWSYPVTLNVQTYRSS